AACSVIYDSANSSMVVFGGRTGADVSNDVWTLSLAGIPTWHLVNAGGTAPPPTQAAGGIEDPASNRLIAVIVQSGNLSTATINETWALSLGGNPTWTKLTLANPPPPSGVEAIVDPVRNRMLISSASYGDVSYALSLSNPTQWSEVLAVG